MLFPYVQPLSWFLSQSKCFLLSSPFTGISLAYNLFYTPGHLSEAQNPGGQHYRLLRWPEPDLSPASPLKITTWSLVEVICFVIWYNSAICTEVQASRAICTNNTSKYYYCYFIDKKGNSKDLCNIPKIIVRKRRLILGGALSCSSQQKAELSTAHHKAFGL